MNTLKHKAPRVKLTPNIEKILAALYFLLEKAEERDLTSITQYDLVKSIFLADRQHLNTYGRPITYDNYCAMQHGPVPSTTYNILKEDTATLAKYEISSLNWQRVPQSGSSKTYVYTLKKNAKCDVGVLSESDKDILEYNLFIVNNLSFSQLRKITHEDAAYLEANPDEERRSPLMSLGMLFDIHDFEAAEQVKFASEHQ